MKAGDLKHFITFQRPESETDERGNRRTVWKDVVNCWASKQDVSGRDFYVAQAHQAQNVVTFGVRWRDSITEECRIVHKGQVYEIKQINNLGYKGDFMHIKAALIRGEGK